MAALEQRGAKAAQLDAAIKTLVTALDRPNPTDRTVSARLKEAGHILAEYGEKHFILLHKIKDQPLLVNELELLDAGLRNKFHDAEERADTILETLRIAADPPLPTYDITYGMMLQLAEGNKETALTRGASILAHVTRLQDPEKNLSSQEQEDNHILLGQLTDDIQETLKGYEALTKFVQREKPAEAREMLRQEQEARRELITELDSVRTTMGSLHVAPLIVVTEPTAQALYVPPSPAYQQNASQYMYQKEPIPKFTGGIREYPAWRKEWVDFLIPARGDDWALKAIDRYTPKSIDLQNCLHIKEAWEELDAKYADSINVSGTLVNDFVAFSTKAIGDESKLVELKEEVMRLYNDLAAVKQEEQLTKNAWLLAQIAQKLPVQLQKDFSKKKTEGVDGQTLWDKMSTFLKEEAKRYERDLPHLLDINRNRVFKSKELQVTVTGKKTKDMAGVKVNLVKSKRFEEMKIKIGPCPHCSVLHTFESRNRKEELVSASFRNCSEFLKLDAKGKAEVVEANKGCAMCLDWRHGRADCQVKMDPCGKPEGAGKCTRLHNRLLHGSSVKYCNKVSTIIPGQERTIFLHMFTIKLPSFQISFTCFTDDGSEISMITEALALLLNLRGRKRTVWLQLAGETKPNKLLRNHYEVTLPLNDGSSRTIQVIGIPYITDNCTSDHNVDYVYELFPHLPKGAVERPKEPVGLLIGQDNAELLPTGGEGRDKLGNLRVLRVNMGTGWVLGGHHPDIEGSGVTFGTLANSLRKGTKTGPPKKDHPIERTCPELVPFEDPEDLSITLPRRCNKCLNCQRCTEQVQGMSRRETDELELIRGSLKVDRTRRKLIVSYPFVSDPSMLRDNEWQAKKMAEQLERKLLRNGGLSAYNEEFKMMLDFPAIQEVNRDELCRWKNQGKLINFISHHDVNRPSKATTQKRMVSNSSLPNGGSGPAVNQLWPKGPNMLKPALKIFLRFRTHEVGLVFDLTKAYWSIETTEVEKFLRLLLWRWGVLEDDWTIYGFCTMAFGDRPAMAVLEEGKERAVEEGGHLDPIASLAISQDSYCDDGLTGGTKEEVDRMMGTTSKDEDGKLSYSGTVSAILDTVGFRVKMMVKSGKNDSSAIEKMGGSVLGHSWDPCSDLFFFKFAVNLSKKGRDGLHTAPDLQEEDLQLLAQHKATRRSVLSVVNSLYDPSGMVSAYLIKFRLFMRDVTALKVGWDIVLPDELQVRWKEFLQELVSMQPITAPRAVRPDNASGAPEMIVYWDGSEVAYSAVIYLRYKVVTAEEGPWKEEQDKKVSWSAALFTSKAKLAPTAGITPPRSEMNGFVLAHRLAMVAVSALRVKPARLTFIGDSECTISAAESNSAFLRPYLANRVGEVDDMVADMESKYPDMVIDPPFHTPGSENTLADMATRGGVGALQVGQGSEWQLGRPYLNQDRATWPITREFVRHVPEEEKRMKVFNLVNLIKGSKPSRSQEMEGAEGLMDRLLNIAHYSNSLTKVRGIMARVLRMSRICAKRTGRLREDEFKSLIAASITVEEYSRADRVLLLLAQSDVREALDRPHRRQTTVRRPAIMNLSSLQPYKEDGVWVTRGRFGKALKKVLGPDSLPILGSTSRLAFLFMVKSHERNHMGGGDTLFRSRSLAWVVRGRIQADTVVRNCPACKRKSRQLMAQQMGDLPEERTTFPCKPWSSTSIDLLGSYLVKAMNNKRSRMKCYPIVCCCMTTGALHVELAHSYGTDSFLCAFSSFVAIRSRPSMIYTDKGSQLTRASNYVATEDDSSTWDWDEVTRLEAQKGTTWRFCPPGAQFRNGLAEARVKALKHTMDLLMASGAESLNFNEFRCLLTRAADIINDRPLGVRHHRLGVEGDLLPITPNLLLLGKGSSSTPDPPQELDEADDQFTRRAAFISHLEKVWWEMWYVQAFDSLFPLPKWKERMSSLAPGDIVLVAWEAKLGKGQYRIARVLKVDKDGKGLVRTATVEMRPKDAREKSLPYKSKTLFKMVVAIQRLVMICPEENVPKLLDVDRVIGGDPATTQDVDSLQGN